MELMRKKERMYGYLDYEKSQGDKVGFLYTPHQLKEQGIQGNT
jgi:hypothetical protein